MIKIAIKFGDNDFHETFKNILYMIGKALKDGKKLNDKEKLVKTINNVSYEMYLLFQDDWSSTEELKENEERIRKHLTITKDDILFDKEVDDYKNGDDFFNSETFILEYDNHLNSLVVYSL